MRKIKFRAWIKFESGNYGMLDNENLQEWSLEELTDGEDILMQFTGLKDKNGKEIYEGDIVRYDRTYQYDIGQSVVQCTDDGEFAPFGSSSGAVIDSSCEIIGNIYENPELLK